MSLPLIQKLEQFTRLSSEDKEVLRQMSMEGVRHLDAREDIIREVDRP